jgi:hypothetical protein
LAELTGARRFRICAGSGSVAESTTNGRLPVLFFVKPPLIEWFDQLAPRKKFQPFTMAMQLLLTITLRLDLEIGLDDLSGMTN